MTFPLSVGGSWNEHSCQEILNYLNLQNTRLIIRKLYQLQIFKLSFLLFYSIYCNYCYSKHSFVKKEKALGSFYSSHLRQFT